MIDPLSQKMAEVAQAVADGAYRYTLHGAQQRIARRISGAEVEEAIAKGVIIEDYPRHHYGPAALILGRTRQNRPLHILCSVQPIVDIVTVYEPDPQEWEADLRTRRTR
jgi:hypothetical protein